jgi:hypothetical protein
MTTATCGGTNNLTTAVATCYDYASRMQLRRSAAIVVGGGLTGAWLASAAGLISVDTTPQPRVVAVPTSGAETLADEVEAQSVRLKERLSRAPSPKPTGRNPFRFESVRPETARRTTPAIRLTELPPPALPAPPPFRLEGIAERDVDGVKTRVAVLSSFGELFFVTEGGAVAGNYRATSVGVDAVELEELATGTVIRLAIR